MRYFKFIFLNQLLINLKLKKIYETQKMSSEFCFT